MDPMHIESGDGVESSWLSKGNAWAKLNKHEEAIYSYDKELMHNPNNIDAWNNKGNSLSKLVSCQQYNVANM